MDGNDGRASGVNPYEAPRFYPEAVEADVQTAVGPTTVCRDGTRMVVPRTEALILPSRCIKTGQPLPEQHRFRQRVAGLHPNHPLTHARWPISPEWVNNSSNGGLLAGIFIFASICLATFLALLPGANTGFNWFLGGISMLAFLFGAASGVSSAHEFLCVVDIQPDYVMLEGAHPDFLKELPQWTAAIDSREA